MMDTKRTPPKNASTKRAATKTKTRSNATSKSVRALKPVHVTAASVRKVDTAIAVSDDPPPPFDFAQIRRSAYELLAHLLMDFENGKPDEKVRYRAPLHVLEQLSTLIGGVGPKGWCGNPFGDGVTFNRPKQPLTVGFYKMGENGKLFTIEEPAPPSDVRVRASRLNSDRDAFALQRLWEVASNLQSYFGISLGIRNAKTNELLREASNPRAQGKPLPSQIIPRLQEAIRLLDEQRPVNARPAFAAWIMILSELDREFPNFRPTIECNPGPYISEQWVDVVMNYSGATPIIREMPETRPFRPLRRLASGLVPLLESVGISLPDDDGSTPDGRLLFWAWHTHTGTNPTLPSWSVTPELGAFAVIMSAVRASVNPDGTAKLNSPNTSRKLVTVTQVADIVHLESKSMTMYVRDWGTPTVTHSGQRPAKYDLAIIRPTLEKQFPNTTNDAWTLLETNATPS